MSLISAHLIVRKVSPLEMDVIVCCEKAETVVIGTKGTRSNGFLDKRVSVFAVSCRATEKVHSCARIHVWLVKASVVHLCIIEQVKQYYN